MGAPTEGKSIEVPLAYLEEEFERQWQLRFDARALGAPTSAAFLRRFPNVFHLRCNGFQMLVSPAEAPNFEQAAEDGMYCADNPQDAQVTDHEFAANLAEEVPSRLINLVAEAWKAGGAPSPFKAGGAHSSFHDASYDAFPVCELDGLFPEHVAYDSGRSLLSACGRDGADDLQRVRR